jgi:hypothetical protein
MSNEEFYLDGRGDWSPDDEAKYREAAAAPIAATAEKYPAVELCGSPKTASAPKKSTQPLYFDLETCPDWSRADSFGLDPLPPIPQEGDIAKMPPAASIVTGTIDDAKRFLRQIECPPAAWLDLVLEQERQRKDGGRSGIVAAVAEARQVRGRIVELHDERRKLLSTTPEFCKIAALGWAVGGGHVSSVVIDSEKVDEASVLSFLWGLISIHSPIIAFNGLHFDLPVILTRSAILGVAPTRMLDMKPWGKDVVDPYAIRFPKGGGNDGRPRKLKALAPLFGIEVPAGDCDGSQVEELYKSDPAKLGEYVKSDVQVLRELHRKLQGYFWM